MKTPDEIASDIMNDHFEGDSPWAEPNEFGETGFTRAQAESDIDRGDIERLITAAIEADRAQRAMPVIEALAEALTERGDQEALDAAKWLRDNEDEAWDGYVGPLLDMIEKEARA